MLKRFLKPLLLAALVSGAPAAIAGQTLVYIADDISGLPLSLDQANTAAIATDDSPIVLVVKDTQVSEALRGTKLERDFREAFASKVRIFICESDLIRYGIPVAKVYPGISLVKAPPPKTEGAAQPAAEALPLERFQKQAEKICNQ